MVRDNLVYLKQRIAAACAKIGRDPATITLVAVTKNRTAGEIRQALEAGVVDIGENRVQEALLKYNDKQLVRSDIQIRWHMVGHLQTNKVKEAVRIFDLIHSVDTIRLAREIDKQAARIEKVQDILLEVNTSGEESKFGIRPQELPVVVQELGGLRYVRARGLMTVAPIVDDAERARPYFRILKELKDRINDMRYTTCDMQILSMGMSDDFEVAIQEGADIIRLGRAIFEG
jgi:pyridoxal phosphate enzyme (YggS family)